tara:strand:- start:9608 stop:10447 length:840 start_codon:yes stop_codon:yes gene_type:complete
MTNKYGVMQGRLVPKVEGRYQAFPIGMWQREFEVARECGLDLIEFILDFNEANENPLLKEHGLDEIKKVIKSTGVSIQSICADYFMHAPLHSKNDEIVFKSQKIIMRLLDSANILGVTDIVIPCVDNSSLHSLQDRDRFVKNMSPVIKIAEEYKINLSLETDLEPETYLSLLHHFQSERVTVNYDIGNSASLGYDPIEELDAYGTRITDIHIKDRELNGGPVVLGQGNADFKKFFKKLTEFNYKNPFIMQAYRDDDGVNIFKTQFKWIKKQINEFYDTQ